MIQTISKSKIPTQYAYVLKAKILENILTDNNIDIYVDLDYWFPQTFGNFFEVHFWLPNENIAYNRLYIRAGALQKKDVFLARRKLEETVLPKFVAWIKNILTLPDDSPKLNLELYFNAVYKDGNLEIFNTTNL